MNEYQEEEFRFEAMKGCIPVFLTWVALVAIVLVVIALTSCSPKVISDTNNEQYHSQLVSRMDSMLHATSVWQQSMYQKQTSLVDSFKNVEVRDTSRVIFLSEKGDTVKETIVIKEIVEREHTSSENNSEYYLEMFRQADSLLQVSIANQERMDSVLQSSKEIAVVKERPPLTEYLKWFGAGIVLSILGMFAFLSSRMRKED